jgi:HEAT repeat protein
VGLFLALLSDADRDLRQAAANALGQLGDGRAESGLSRALGDDDLDVRSACEHALKALQTARPA